MLLPENTSAQHQAALAQYIRHPETATPPQGIERKRLAVYAELVRTNLASFLNRCFSATKTFVDDATWQDLQAVFLQQGEPQSPYFRDIPGQFLHFLQSQKRLPETFLTMMDFEHHQLLAEIAPLQKIANGWHESSLLRPAKSAFLLHYPIDFISSDWAKIEDCPVQIVLWRDGNDDVCHRLVDGIEYALLAHFFAQSDSFSHLLTALSAEMGDVQSYRDWLEKNIEQWLAEGILLIDDKGMDI